MPTSWQLSKQQLSLHLQQLAIAGVRGIEMEMTRRSWMKTRRSRR
jgi:hypothetical protein